MEENIFRVDHKVITDQQLLTVHQGEAFLKFTLQSLLVLDPLRWLGPNR
jgi:hypothetical protein